MYIDHNEALFTPYRGIPPRSINQKKTSQPQGLQTKKKLVNDRRKRRGGTRPTVQTKSYNDEALIPVFVQNKTPEKIRSWQRFSITSGLGPVLRMTSTIERIDHQATIRP